MLNRQVSGATKDIESRTGGCRSDAQFEFGTTLRCECEEEETTCLIVHSRNSLPDHGCSTLRAAAPSVVVAIGLVFRTDKGTSLRSRQAEPQTIFT